MPAQYILSRSLDPIFAVSIGVAATLVRIRREESEKGKSWSDTAESLKCRFDLAWNGDKARSAYAKS